MRNVITAFGAGLISIVILGASMNAEAGLFGFSDKSWKEEVLLHDGSKIIVKRSFNRGGGHEPGQAPSIKEQDITFTVPGSNKTITWKSEYSKDVGRANFNLLALHIQKGFPYLVTEPNLCLSYNKWGRPNPPYVLFRHDGTAWQRIALAELPAEFKELNVVMNIDEQTLFDEIDKQEVLSAATIRKLNSSLTQPQLKRILREALPQSQNECPQYSSGPKAPN